MNYFAPEITEALGWTIVHALWQATAVAIVLGLILLIIRKKSAQIKYFLSFVALLGIFAWSAATFVQSYNYAVEKREFKEQMLTNRTFLKSVIAPSGTDSDVETAVKEQTVNLTQVKLRSFFQRNFNTICSVWFIGLIFLMLKLITDFVVTHRLRTYRLVPVADEWHQKLVILAERLGLRRKVQAFFSPLTKTPITIGVIKPVILFPVTAFTGLSAKEVEAIIAHELAHVLRHDYLFNIVQSMVEILFFYHPAIWIISAQIRAERENSCDNLAVMATGDRLSYVKTLASIQIRQQDASLSMAFSRRKGSLLQRVQRLQNEIAMKTNFIEGLIAAGVIVGGLMFASFAFPRQDSKMNSGASVAMEYDSISAPFVSANHDSVFIMLEEKLKNKELSQKEAKELQKAVEVAMSENDEQVSAEIMYEINRALQEIDVNRIVREAMCVAAEAMKEASVEVERARREVIGNNEIRRDMQEARREIEQARKEVERDMRRDMAADGVDQATIDAAVSAALAGLDIAAGVVGSIDVEGIVNSALTGVSSALSAIGQINCDTVEKPIAPPSGQKDYDARVKQLEKERKQLQKEQEQLEKRLKELEKKLEKIE